MSDVTIHPDGTVTGELLDDLVERAGSLGAPLDDLASSLQDPSSWGRGFSPGSRHGCIAHDPGYERHLVVSVDGTSIEAAFTRPYPPQVRPEWEDQAVATVADYVTGEVTR